MVLIFLGRDEMENFCKEHAAARLTPFQVRTKINNERKKYDHATARKLSELGIPS